MAEQDRSTALVVVEQPASVPARSSLPHWPWSWRTTLRYALVTCTILGVLWILWQSWNALLPFIIGLVLAYLLVPLVSKLDRWMPRWASILVVYVVALGVIGTAITVIVPPAATQINEVAQDAPRLYEQGRTGVDKAIDWFNAEAPAEVRTQVQAQIDKVQATIQENASRYAQNAGRIIFNSLLSIFQTLTFLLGFLIIPFFLFYVLVDSDRLPKVINRMLHPRLQADWWNMVRIVDTILGKYIRGQLILGAVVGACSFIGLMILRLFGFNVRFSVLLALVAAVGELIPVVGPILSAIPAVLVGLTDGVKTGLAVAVLYIAIQQIENQILVPRIVGNTLRLHAAILMASLVIAAQLGGLFLVILVAPLTAIARDLFVYLHQRLQEPPIPPAEAVATVMMADRTSGS